MCSNNSKDDILKLCASLSSKYKKPQRLIENPILREDEYAAVKALEISYITDIDISSISPPVCLIWEELIHDAKKAFPCCSNMELFVKKRNWVNLPRFFFRSNVCGKKSRFILEYLGKNAFGHYQAYFRLD